MRLDRPGGGKRAQRGECILGAWSPAPVLSRHHEKDHPGQRRNPRPPGMRAGTSSCHKHKNQLNPRHHPDSSPMTRLLADSGQNGYALPVRESIPPPRYTMGRGNRRANPSNPDSQCSPRRSGTRTATPATTPGNHGPQGAIPSSANTITIRIKGYPFSGRDKRGVSHLIIVPSARAAGPVRCPRSPVVNVPR